MSTTKKNLGWLALGALGVVFGDIGTSPLYALSAVFGRTGIHLALTETHIYGVISLIIWSITLVVSIKFLGFIMLADNNGEGGIMALVASVKESFALTERYRWIFILIGLVGVSLFYGDSTITPAISVLSAVEGLNVITPTLSSFIVPITLVILVILFSIQRYGTNLIGRLFGPIMLLWFVTIAIGGGWQVWQHPGVLVVLSPLTGLRFFFSNPILGLIAMGAVVLAVTGAEALYADMGHFGRAPIARAWFWIVFPALLLCYMGQGALLVQNPAAIANPLLLLYPEPLRLTIVLLATAATIIASQAVISGAFSLTRQAVQLNFLPKILIRHTSTQEGGQIYVPFVNAALFIVVVLLVLLFGSSAHLANAYGIAVSGTLLADTILYLVVVRTVWHRPMRTIFWASLAFLPIDLIFVTSTLPKLMAGGWFPLLVGAVVLLLITTWVQGQLIATTERKVMEGPLDAFIEQIDTQNPPLVRIPGTAVFIGHHPGFAPLALHATVKDLHELPEKVIVVSIETTGVSHIPEAERATIEHTGHKDGITYIRLQYGFHDSPNIPKALAWVKENTKQHLGWDLGAASYFISISRVVATKRHNLAPWRKQLFGAMSHNATSPSDYYRLPIEHTVEMQSLIPL
jgi:KUP system potassium uptake protein